jgi:PHD/YefM family antitoxin component YafN of YafNO toxin-antitoxin module
MKELEAFRNFLKEAFAIDDKGQLVNTDERWAFYVDSEDDWEILSKFLEEKDYKFTSGNTFSKYKLSDFNPFKSERKFGDEGQEDEDAGYSYAMSYQGINDFVLLQMPNKKLTIVYPSTFNSKRNSTYRNYTLYKNLSDLFKIIEI